MPAGRPELKPYLLVGALLATSPMSAGCSRDLNDVAEGRVPCSSIAVSGASATVYDLDITHGDIAFRVGCEDNFWLAVVDPRARRWSDRSSRANAGGSQAAAGQMRAYAGPVLAIPYPEATDSWGLTHSEERLLEERNGYIRLVRVAEGTTR